ncbi:hypothetical protein BN2476_490068 [Paraburkholderia piptadeniae]|uniref:Uncharacterized protein n=1 Tax=Paraburkholderia piptadeniae TaxID=1701573 RepID=A0A1N7SEZ8_9BURK|nr:hypothetical protein BN2476_490068 [Paraburkholderia piptadeniae]
MREPIEGQSLLSTTNLATRERDSASIDCGLQHGGRIVDLQPGSSRDCFRTNGFEPRIPSDEANLTIERKIIYQCQPGQICRPAQAAILPEKLW